MSGKSSLARELSSQLGLPIYPLAAPIKYAAYELGDPDPWGPEKLRWIQQGIGQLCTEYDTDYFVKLWFKQHADFHQTGAIVDDVRRIPEYRAFKQHAFLLVRLNVSQDEQLARGATVAHNFEHPTEMALDHSHPVDFHLWFGEQTTLEQRVAAVLDELTRQLERAENMTEGWADAHDEIDALLP